MTGDRFFGAFFRAMVRTVGEARGAIGLGALLFVAGAVLGAVLPDLSRPLIASLQSLAQELAGHGMTELAVRIFLRNAAAASVAIFSGVLFGVMPALAALSNGLLVGAVMSLVPGEIWKVVPHGVFELPAMFTAWGLGLWIGGWPVGAERLRRLGQRLIAASRVLLGMLLPLLVIAALIEAFAAVHLYRTL